VQSIHSQRRDQSGNVPTVRGLLAAITAVGPSIPLSWASLLRDRRLIRQTSKGSSRLPYVAPTKINHQKRRSGRKVRCSKPSGPSYSPIGRSASLDHEVGRLSLGQHWLERVSFRDYISVRTSAVTHQFPLYSLQACRLQEREEIKQAHHAHVPFTFPLLHPYLAAGTRSREAPSTNENAADVEGHGRWEKYPAFCFKSSKLSSIGVLGLLFPWRTIWYLLYYHDSCRSSCPHWGNRQALPPTPAATSAKESPRPPANALSPPNIVHDSIVLSCHHFPKGSIVCLDCPNQPSHSSPHPIPSFT
jgi:hypothetical protein